MGKAVIRYGVLVGMMLLVASPARAVDDQQIKAGIAKAVADLKGIAWAPVAPPSPAGGARSDHEEGPMALAGIALMEAGVDPGDPVIQRMAKIIREQAIKQSKTYQLAL